MVLLVLWSQEFRWAKSGTDRGPLWLQEIVKTYSLLIMTTPRWVICCIVIYTEKNRFEEQAVPLSNFHQDKAVEGSETSLLRKNDAGQVQDILEQSPCISANTNYSQGRPTLRSEVELVQEDAIGLAV